MGAPRRTARLREHLPELLEAIKAGRVPAWAREYLRGLVQRDHQAAATLAKANAERHEQVRDAIHRAADRYLSDVFRSITPRRAWAGALWRYLARRHAQFGLQARPCRRSISEALINWAPPTGGYQSSDYAEGDNSGGRNGGQGDQRQLGRGEGEGRSEDR